MREAYSRLSDLVSGLERNPAVEVQVAEITAPASQAELESAVEAANGRLPVGVEDFYREVGSFRLEWSHANGSHDTKGRPVRGTINILPVHRVFSDWRGITWFPGQDAEFRPVKPFDMFTSEACTAFVNPINSPPRETMSYHYFGEELHDTGYSFNEYMERLIASRGYWYWVQTLCLDSEGRQEVQSFRENMHLIFSDYNDTLFHPSSSTN